MIRAHVAAVRALLESVPNLDVFGDDEIVVDPVTGVRAIPVTPYVVLYSDMGRGESSRLSGRVSGRVWVMATLYVGATEAQARWAAEKAQAALEGGRPVVAGFACTGLRKVSSTLTHPDYDVSPTLYTATDEWQYASTAA